MSHVSKDLPYASARTSASYNYSHDFLPENPTEAERKAFAKRQAEIKWQADRQIHSMQQESQMLHLTDEVNVEIESCDQSEDVDLTSESDHMTI